MSEPGYFGWAYYVNDTVNNYTVGSWSLEKSIKWHLLISMTIDDTLTFKILNVLRMNLFKFNTAAILKP